MGCPRTREDQGKAYSESVPETGTMRAVDLPPAVQDVILSKPAAYAKQEVTIR
jgi:hypothetical protein